MTPRPSRHPHVPWGPRRPDDAGISSVLGAILVFGVLVVTLVTIQVRFVPRWEEDREGQHMDDLANQLAIVKSDLDRLATNATHGTVTDPISPQPGGGGFRFFRTTASSGGGAEFEPAGAGGGLVLASPALRVQVRDGEELFGLEEDWQAIPSDDVVTDIQKVRHLRVRVDVSALDQGDDGATATLSILDANNAFAGKVVITYFWQASESRLQAVSFNPSDQEVSRTEEAFFHNSGLDHMYIDLLDDSLLFDDILAAAAKPMTLELSTNGLDADYTVVFTDGGGGSGGTGAGGGLIVPNYSDTLTSGSLSLRTGYQQLPDLTYVLEHGAVLAVQSDGAAMAIPPSLFVAATPQQAVFDLTLPGLDGSTAGFSGSRTLSLVASSTGERTQFEALAARFSITLPSAYPDVWASYLEAALEGAGLSDDGPSPQFTITPSPAAVQLDLFGPTSAPSDTTEDLVLRLQYAAIDLTLRPTG